MNVGEWEERAGGKKKRTEVNEGEKGEERQGASCKIAGETSSWESSIIRVTQPQSSRGDRRLLWGTKLGMEQVWFREIWAWFCI